MDNDQRSSSGDNIVVAFGMVVITADRVSAVFAGTFGGKMRQDSLDTCTVTPASQNCMGTVRKVSFFKT